MRFRIPAIVLLFLLAIPLCAQEKPNPYERMLESKQQVTQHLIREARRITDAAAGEIASKDHWEKIREQRRKETLQMLGLDPLPPRTPLNVQITGVIDQPDYTIEKIAFESMPQIFATANLYIPKKHDGPLPAVIYVCGHAYSPHGNKVMYQRHAITLARHGYVAMIIDSIQIAETFALHHGVLNNEMYDWYSRGYTPAGVEVWNVIRALDYLETRREVDKTRIGITGRSGGAAMSWFSAAVEPRIKVAVPVMGNSTYAANVEANTQRRHCDCMFVINSHMHDMMHQGALIAPRPLYMMHGRQDLLFPMPGYEEFEQTIAKLYTSYGGSEKFKNLVVESGHQDSDLLRGEAVKWFDRWLKQIPAREIDLGYTDLPGEQLAVFAGNPPKDAQNYRVHRMLIPDPQPRSFATKQAWLERREELQKVVSKQSLFRSFPAGDSALNVRPGVIEAPAGLESLQFESEPGIPIQVLYRKAAEPLGPALLYIASDGEDVQSMLDTLRPVTRLKMNPLMIVYPRGIGEVSWDKKFWKDTLRNGMYVGRTVDSMRLWDVLRAVEVLAKQVKLLAKQTQNPPVATLGIGDAGILGLYAALLDHRIGEVMLIDPPTTHQDGPIFLDVLRHTDLPEVAGLLAPRRLTFYGQIPEEFEPARRIYSVAGAQDRLSLTMSIEAALNGRHHHNFASGL
jgi:dienelactone hydrolase